jgi:protein SCO1/2
VIEVEGRTVLIAHQEIAGIMPAMTMPFAVNDPRDRERLSPGDAVQFTFRMGGSQSEAANFTVTGRNEAVVREYRAAVAGNSARLRPGDRVPEFSLVDQDGRPVTAGDLAGRPTVITFIFTRCPVPEFCPLVITRFRDVQRALVRDAALDDVRLLSITLDPAYDTPQVLASYGNAVGADFRRWRFATGTPDDVAAIARAFAVHSELSDGVINHTLATALIDANGDVVEIWRGNGWESREVIEALANVTRPAKP